MSDPSKAPPDTSAARLKKPAASVGVSTSKLVRSEGQVIRHNMGWTLIILAYLIVISLLFYYILPNRMMM